ncbi:MAG: hypothetical protein HRU00_05540 [Myxococcales bacterium]|nr:hypothetical protein [Myxococcales bacterium]
MADIDIRALPVLDSPPFTRDLAQARAQFDAYGLCVIHDALTIDEVARIGQRL